MLSHPFSQNHVHFIADDMQDEVAPELRLALHYRDGFVVTTYLDDKHNYFFLDGASMDCNASTGSTVLVRFHTTRWGLS